VLRYERIQPASEIVVLGVVVEMLRRDVAASWTFLGPLGPGEFLKPFFTLDGDGLRLHPIPVPLTRQAIAAHHAEDAFRRDVWTELKFPYTLAAAHAIAAKIAGGDRYALFDDRFWDVAHPSGSGVLARRLIDRLAQATRKRNAKLIVVMLPHVDRLLAESPHYDRFTDDLRPRANICVIDTKPALRAQARAGGLDSLAAPRRHYNALANRLIADAVRAGLDDCSFAIGHALDVTEPTLVPVGQPVPRRIGPSPELAVESLAIGLCG